MISESLFLWVALIAFLYASIGHGGASGYLASMTLFGLSSDVMKTTALSLNIFVALLSFAAYFRAGHFEIKKFFPFAITSVPFSFIGGYMEIDEKWYRIILGVVLILATARILMHFEERQERKIHMGISLLLGASIGLVSGLLGIGGGILLTPLILLLGWADIRQAAAISALFIFVNSIAGLIGRSLNGLSMNQDMLILVVSALIGGYFGAYFGVKKFNSSTLKYILAFVLIIASYKLIFTE